jgi:hypothetical protein
LIKTAINIANTGYFLAGDPTVNILDLTSTASAGIEVPKLILDFTLASPLTPLSALKYY